LSVKACKLLRLGLEETERRVWTEALSVYRG